ncbi:DUF881 domain-containing protein [Actinoallomurus purpureus]|uniref:DUF881 domain-containing protein n=1 Tax=Actinoallomurus purpureus TaxID=478114 RepID=UPI002091E67B|nr:DUF881 domain-containing protein [Actinoallomurus purpureus]MCO6007379.1 DUF881 domain-containing protein [Actinoallomurus purpureus]
MRRKPGNGGMSGAGRAWRYAIPALTIFAGTLFTASASTAHGTDLRGGGRTKITELIAQEQRQYQGSQAHYGHLRRQVEGLVRAAGQRDARVKAAQEDADRLAARTGFAPLTGGGVRVSLDDAPPGRRIAGDPGPDDLVVHQQDVQAVVNALWTGGATGVQIMDQRLISTSAVRCVGNTLILQGVVYSPPFRITATGDPGRLRAALDASPAIQVYRQYVAEYGLGYTVTTLKKTTLPAYTGNVQPKYATAQEPDGANAHP